MRVMCVKIRERIVVSQKIREKIELFGKQLNFPQNPGKNSMEIAHLSGASSKIVRIMPETFQHPPEAQGEKQHDASLIVWMKTKDVT